MIKPNSKRRSNPPILGPEVGRYAHGAPLAASLERVSVKWNRYCACQFSGVNPAKAGIQYSPASRELPGRPLELVIGPAEGRTRWRAMTRLRDSIGTKSARVIAGRHYYVARFARINPTKRSNR